MHLTNNDSKISWTWRREDHFLRSTHVPNMVHHMYVNSTCGPPMIHLCSTHIFLKFVSTKTFALGPYTYLMAMILAILAIAFIGSNLKWMIIFVTPLFMFHTCSTFMNSTCVPPMLHLCSAHIWLFAYAINWSFKVSTHISSILTYSYI